MKSIFSYSLYTGSISLLLIFSSLTSEGQSYPTYGHETLVTINGLSFDAMDVGGKAV